MKYALNSVLFAFKPTTYQEEKNSSEKALDLTFYKFMVRNLHLEYQLMALTLNNRGSDEPKYQ